MNNTKLKLGMTKVANTLKSFDIEFQPFIEEINAREGAIRKFADAATMESIRSTLRPYIRVWARSNACAQALKVSCRMLHPN